MMRTSVGWEKKTVPQKGFRNGLQSSRIFVIGRDSIDRMGDRAKRGLVS